MPSNESLKELFAEETVVAFGKRDSQLRKTTITKTDIKADSATFMVSDIAGKDMSTRGADGRIPANPPSDEQFNVKLTPLYYKEAKNDYNIFSQQGDQFELMKSNVVAVAERRMDSEIMKTLENATLDANSGAAVALTANTLLKKVIGTFGTLADEAMPWMTIPAGAFADMHDIGQFGNRDYVQDERFNGIPKSKAFEWFGINFIVMPDDFFPGAVADKTAYAWMPGSVGHACDKEGASFDYGYNGEDKYSWANAAIFTGSKIIQPAGVMKVHLDISANVVT